MDYLYHAVPENLQGEYLMPLNELKGVHPEIYTKELEKYKGREKLLKVKIPQLNCLWNDVIHMTSVQPKKLDAAFSEAGTELEHRKWFKINPEFLEKNRLLVYLFPDKPFLDISAEDFADFREEDLERYGRMGEKTRDYFREMSAQGRSPMMFHLVPHILYKGKLNIGDLDVVKI